MNSQALGRALEDLGVPDGEIARVLREGQEPVTWCRVFQQRVCPHPCVDCKRADANYTDDDRRRILEGVHDE